MKRSRKSRRRWGNRTWMIKNIRMNKRIRRSNMGQTEKEEQAEQDEQWVRDVTERPTPNILP